MVVARPTLSRTPPCGLPLYLAALATRESSSALWAGLLATPAPGKGVQVTPATVAQLPVQRQQSFRVVSWPPCAQRPLRHAGCPCLLHGGPHPRPSLRRLPIASGTAPAVSSVRCTGRASCPGRALWLATPCPFLAAWCLESALPLPRLRSSSTGARTSADTTRRQELGPCSGTSGQGVPRPASDGQPWLFRG